MRALGGVEDVVSRGVPEALVQVTAVTVFPGEGLGHEARRQPFEPAELFRAVAKEQRAVGGLESRRMANVHLVHAFAVLAVIALDGHAVRIHLPAQPSDDELVAGGPVQAVTARGGAERREVAPLLGAQRALVLAPDAELQLQRQLRTIPHPTRALEHATQNLARGAPPRLTLPHAPSAAHPTHPFSPRARPD